MTKAIDVLRVAVAVFERDGAYLVTQRLESSIFPGLWEFPGGRVREGESLEETLRRTLKTRLGIEPIVGEILSSKRHAYANYEVTLTMVQCTIDDVEPTALEVASLRWVPTSELDTLDWVPADLASMRKLIAELD